MSLSRLFLVLCLVLPNLCPADEAQAHIGELVKALAEAKTDHERQDLLDANKNLQTAELCKALLVEGVKQRRAGDYSKAIAFDQIARGISDGLGEKTIAAQALSDMGVVEYYQDQYESALAHQKQSLEIRESLNEMQGIAESRRRMGNIYYVREDYDTALQYFQNSLSINESLSNQAGIADDVLSIGNLFRMKGEYATALDHLGRSLKLRETLGDPASIAESLRCLASVYLDEGDYDVALDYLKRTLALDESLDDKSHLAFTFNLIAYIYMNQSDYGNAAHYYHQSLELSEAIGDKSYTANSLVALGIIHSAEGNDDIALDYYRKALLINKEIGSIDEAAQTLSAIARIYLRRGDLGAAMEHLENALQLQPERPGNVVDLKETIGKVQQQLGNFDKALEYYQESLQISESHQERAAIADVLTDIANVYLQQEKPELALDFATRGAEAAKKLDRYETLSVARTIIGKAHWKLNALSETRQDFESAIAAVEKMRSEAAGGEEEQSRFLQNRLAPYHAMIALLVAQNQYAEAFAYAEKARARVLLDVLRSGKSQINKSLTLQEQQKGRNLTDRLASLNAQISFESQRPHPDEKRLQELERNLKEARGDFESFQAAVYAGHPELKVQRGEVPSITSEEAAAILPNPQAAMLEYVVADDKAFLFTLTLNQDKPELNAFPIEMNHKDLLHAVENLDSQLASHDPGYRESAGRLYALLLSPAAKALKGKDTLIIVPDAELWNLPFQALLSPAGRYTTEDYAVSYEPSITALREMIHLRQNKQPGVTPALLAFGNPTVLRQTESRMNEVYRNQKMEPLPEAETEVHAIAELYGSNHSEVLTRSEAREDTFKSEAAGYDILHMATHAVLDDVNPMYSKLVLSQKTSGTSEDGLLEAWEILNLNLKADLVVLSACDTARGRVGAGEGIIGLSWAFFVAGSSTTMVSQWPVETNSTSRLMILFHRNLRSRHLSKADALRQAELQLMKSTKYKHPFYWAGFVLVGAL